MPGKFEWPHVSVIVVNYNGRHLLSDCLGSLQQLQYPGTFEVLVVDNNSQDDSCSYIQKNYPDVKLIISQENVGFAGGNNSALSSAKGDLLAFVNSDTKVDAHWLTELVKTAQEHPRAGLISSQLLYFTPYIELEIQSEVLSESELIDSTDFTPLGIMLEDIVIPDDGLGSKVWYGKGFYELKRGPVSTRWTREKAVALLPFPKDNGKKLSYTITVHGHQINSKRRTSFSVSLVGRKRVEESVGSHEVKQYTFSLNPDDVKKHELHWLVQNAGNCVLGDGYSRDRGSIVVRSRNEVFEFYEERSQYFDTPSNLMAVCGGGFLTRRELVDELGLFNEDYFMYYEDLDLSLRYWKAGWDILYCPTSLVYHKHRATTGKTESVFFLYHLEKNHILFVLTHFPWTVIVSELFLFSLRMAATELKTFLFGFRNNLMRHTAWKQKRSARRQAFFSIIRLLVPTLTIRLKSFEVLRRSRQDWKKMIY